MGAHLDIKPTVESSHSHQLLVQITSHLRMASLHVFVCLLGLVVLCHSDCFFQELVIKDLKNPPKGCVDKDGKQHDFGSEWVRDCMECSCSTEGLSCCSEIPDADTVDIPEECELIVNKEGCSVQVVLKSDKTTECNPL